jgi:hypothetical protein
MGSQKKIYISHPEIEELGSAVPETSRNSGIGFA